jgi:hypothetical protein
MIKRGSTFAVGLLLVCLPAAPIFAQGKRAAPTRKAAERPARVGGMRELERFEKMPTAQRQEELAKLPPERRQQIERRLAHLAKLTPEQRSALNKRWEQFQHLPPDRQDAVRTELQHLRSMPEADRAARLNSPEMKKQFSGHELNLLREASGAPEMP